jgi:uncharacterized membrane protein
MPFVRFIKTFHEPKAERIAEKRNKSVSPCRGLVVAPDFEVGSDVLKTLVVPTIADLAMLAIIVSIRILLAWSSLTREITGYFEEMLRKGK